MRIFLISCPYFWDVFLNHICSNAHPQINALGISVNWGYPSVSSLGGSPINVHFPLVAWWGTAGRAWFFSPCLSIWQQINSQRSLMYHARDTSTLLLYKGLRKRWVSRQILWQRSFIWRVSEAWVCPSNLSESWRKNVEVKNTEETICLVDSGTFGQTSGGVEFGLFGYSQSDFLRLKQLNHHHRNLEVCYLVFQ